MSDKKGHASVTPPKKFVGLHAHTGASTFDGLGPPPDHFKWCVENGLDAHAITEHGHMNSFAVALLYNEKMKKEGKPFKYIPGVEAYTHPDLNLWRQHKIEAEEAKEHAKEQKKLSKKQREGVVRDIERVTDGDDETVSIETSNSLTIENEEETKSGKTFNPVNRRHHLVVLPKTSGALLKIFHLVSRGYLEGFYRFPRIDLKMIKEAAKDKDILLSSACLGGTLSFATLSQLRHVAFEKLDASILDDPSVMNSVMSSVANTFDGYADAVGPENMLLELQFNKLPAQDVVNRALMEFARRNGLEKQLIVTADSHYPRPELWKHREMYKKLGYLNYTDIGPESLPKSRDELKCELYPKNASQVWDEYLLSKERNPFYGDEDTDKIIHDAIERTYDIAHEVISEVSFDKSYKYPTKIIPEDTTPFKVLLELSLEGLTRRGLADKPEYVERLKHELTVIKKMENAAYFVTLAKALRLARGVSLLGIARGSSGGSLVAYVLDITDLDPVRYECRFDRFLNVHRCLDPETFVLMSDGSAKKIKDIERGDEVITDRGIQPIADTFMTTHNVVIKIIVNDQTITCSANHKWIVVDNEGNHCEKLACELTENDSLYIYQDDKG
jgi:DNA polymerase III alpha subunit